MIIPVFIPVHNDCDRREYKPPTGKYQYWQNEDINKKYKRRKAISNVLMVIPFVMAFAAFIFSFAYVIDIEHPIFSILAPLGIIFLAFILPFKMFQAYDDDAELYSTWKDKTVWRRYKKYERGYKWDKPDSEIPEGYILADEGYTRW
jgi:hypothetical protein